MTERQIRDLVADTALEFLGCNEADGTHKPIINTYNSIRPLPVSYRMSYSDPWCAAFVSVVGVECGLGDIILPECSCDRMISLYKAAGRWKEADDYVPAVGDIVMYDWQDSGVGDNLGSADHVGIVYSRTGNTMTIIEGNISDSVDFRNLKVNSRNIRGYCLPAYHLKAVSDGAEQQPEPEKAPATPYITVQLPVLIEGATGKTVKAAQQLLLANLNGSARTALGVSGGADGEFGPGTRTAVINFQTKVGLKATALIDNDTWSRLLGIT